jgi:TrmH family RNA methyltransferase
VRRAARLAQRSVRAAAGEFLAEGPQAVRAGLLHGAVREVFGTAAAAQRHPDLPQLAGERWTLVERDVLTALADTVQPQGVVARCAIPSTELAQLLAKRPRLVAVAVDVRDPGNAGTLIRCADAAGAAAVVLAGESVDSWNPKAVRASAGSVFHVDLLADRDVPRILTALRTAGLRLLAADGSGASDLDALADVGALAARTAWIFGNEAHGLTDLVREQADDVVRVPIHGRAESLNLATAAAVCLYASARAMRAGDRPG